MTNLGFQTVYHLFNEIDRCVCERAFLPPKEDMDEFIRTSTGLFSLESQTPLKDFDVLAFSIPFEDDYINIPRVLELAGIPILSSQRKTLTPVIMAGGVAVSLNPEPMAELMDLFLIGEGEGSITQTIDLYGLYGKAVDKGLSKKEALKEFDAVEWVYVPSLYEFTFDGAKIKEVKALEGAKQKVKAAKHFDLDGFDLPQNFILTPDTEFKDTFCVEVERGCGRGCRFCAAGFLYLPPRWRDFEAVKRTVKKGIDSTGKVGLVGTAVSEYPRIKETISFGVKKDGVMTLSSLRMDRLDSSFMELLKKGGYRTITLAPEAGTERMRSVVNKGLSDSGIMDAIRLVTEAGFLKLKLYFLVGLPEETDEDAEGIVDLCKRIRSVMKKGELTLSVNPFIPKPFTPFQWHRFENADVVEKRLKIIKKGLGKEKGVIIKALSAREAFIQAYIARADRRAGELIITASKKGWKEAVRKVLPFIRDSVYTGRIREELLPWDIIDHGIKKSYLWREYEKGIKGGITPPCDVGRCFRCGVCIFSGPSKAAGN